MTKLGSNASPQPDLEQNEMSKAPEALLRAFNDLRDELVSTLYYLLGSREDAQDAAQEAFLKCWRAQESLKEVRNMRAWIFRVGLNVARDLQRSTWYRRSKQFAGEELILSGAEVGPDQNAENAEMMERLRQAIMQLRTDEKEVFLLRQNGDLTFEEIAEMRRVPLGTVKTQMRSALQKLRQRLT